MSNFILATIFVAVCLVGPAALQSEAHHCHHHRNFYGYGNNSGYGAGGTFIDRLLGNGYGGYGNGYGGYGNGYSGYGNGYGGYGNGYGGYGNGYGGYGNGYGGNGLTRFVGNLEGNRNYPGNSYFGHHRHHHCGRGW